MIAIRISIFRWILNKDAFGACTGGSLPYIAAVPHELRETTETANCCHMINATQGNSRQRIAMYASNATNKQCH